MIRSRSSSRGGAAGGAEPRSPAEVARAARAAALRALARRARTSSELAAILARRGFERDVADEAIAALRAIGLVDESAVAHEVARDAARRRRGSRFVREVMARRGVAPDARGEALASSAAEDERSARDALARRFGPELPRDRRGVARAFRFLVARGFPAGAARRALGIDLDVESADDA